MRDHLPEYLSEFLGTAIMMMIGIGAVAFAWGQGSPMHSVEMSDGLRRLLTGTIFASGGTLVVLSPLGQRSGGHLNPAVTWAFWWKGQVPASDAIFYTIAQCLGATLGVCIVAFFGGTIADSVQLGLTTPGPGYPASIAFAAEAMITFLLMYLILHCVNNPKIASLTPYFAGILVAFLVFLEAPVSGTSLNPARSLAPALLTGLFENQWLYWVAPVLGAFSAVSVFKRLSKQAPASGCAKLFHTENYRCIFPSCGYTLVEAGKILIVQGDPGDRAFVLERGELEVRERNASGIEVVLGRLHPGDWVGEMSLLLNTPRSASVVAIKDSQLRTVTAENFAHVVKDHPAETLRLLKQMAARLASTNEKVMR